MCRLTLRLLVPAVLLFGVNFVAIQETSAYDQQVYNNLLKSRDALLAQQAELQRAYDETQKQIDALNQKMTRIDNYMKQVNSSIKDVDTALLYAKQ